MWGYNLFKTTNATTIEIMDTIKPEHKISHLLKNIAQTARIEILLTIGEGEACVCHLEAVLGYRQAYISQHLMAMRQAGIITSRREGRYIFYRLKEPKLLDLIALAGSLAGVDAEQLELSRLAYIYGCECPSCEPVAETIEENS
jgi:ArsR family transcriptional regulator